MATQGRTFQAFDPRRGTVTQGEYRDSREDEIRAVAELAHQAAPKLGALSGSEISEFLMAIRDEILELGDELIAKADEETALGIERLRGERDRTVNQIKLFAELAREASWVDARIDTPKGDRKPLPKPDLRRMLEPLGPIAVFGASNFPMAFSVAGGDTASAFAARNPVIVKAHPAHPGTSEMVGGAVDRAVEKRSLPKGTFCLLHGINPAVSIALVTNSHVKAVGFTGSLRAGRALFDAAARRAEPIPVFAEMGSVNPVFLLPSAMEKHAESTAEALYRSMTLSVGQMCTCPGLAFGLAGDGFEKFSKRLFEQTEQGVPGTMLNSSIAKGFAEGFEKASKIAGVEARVSARASDPQKTEGRPGVLVTDAPTWLRNHELHEELFGPSTAMVSCETNEQMLACARELEGSLTATLHGTPDELAQNSELIGVLRRKAGRLIFNGYPTGVELGYAMQHGGPYPATTDARFTSVGTAAIYRFARPVCFQNFPDATLPPELQNANPLGIWRTVDGRLTRDGLLDEQVLATR